MKNKHLIISGIQGSGKGTQARLLAKRFEQYVHISSGDLCRWHLGNQTHFGEKLSVIHQGKFVDNETIIQIVEEKIQSLKVHSLFILDGFPRNIQQAEYLLNNYNMSAVIHLDLSPYLAVQRTQNRLKEKIVRLDDLNADAIKKRIQLYNQNNKSLSKLYKAQNLFHTFSSKSSPDVIHNNIVSHLQFKEILPQD